MFFVSSYSTTEKLRLLSNYQDSDCSLGVFADYHEVRTANMTKWIKQFLLAGLAGLIRPRILKIILLFFVTLQLAFWSPHDSL